MITQEDKKNLISLMFSINQMLDTYRTNLNIVQYNILTNDKMNKLPKFDYDLIKKICVDLGNALNGTIREYNDMKATAPITATQKTINAEAIKEIKKGNKK